MKTQVKKTNFAKHEKRIVAGELETVYGWLDAALECRKLEMKLSKYAELSATKNCKHKAKTIADYVGSFVNALKKYDGNTEAMWKDYDLVYTYRNISDFRNWAKQFGQRANSEKKVEEPSTARTITYNGAVKDLSDAGFTTIEINAITKALRLRK